MSVNTITGNPAAYTATSMSSVNSGSSSTSVATLSPSQNSTAVTLSDEAKRRNALATAGVSDYWQKWSQTLHESTDSASVAKYVETFATAKDGELVALGPNSDGIRDVYYTSNGQPVTDQTKAYFADMSAKVLAERTKIYNTEVAKGTPPADIFDKLAIYQSSLPTDYLQMMGWE